MSLRSDVFPLAWDTTDAPSAFNPADWFAYCSRVTGRDVPSVPALAIQTVIPAHMDLVTERYGAVQDDFTLADHPFAIFRHDGRDIVLATSAKGSYAAGGLDELIAMGARHIVFLGGSATLCPEVEIDDLFIPTRALRDECVSYHYLPPSRYVDPSEPLTDALIGAAARHPHPVKSGPNWTTLAHFRQALPRLRAFRDEGCMTVNNEAAPAFAVGRARGVNVAALLSVGDTLARDRFEIPADYAKLYQAGDVAHQLDIALAALADFAEG